MKWYDRDGLLTYFDQLKYQEYSKDTDSYLSRFNVVNFDMIHAKCHGQEQKNSNKFYKTVSEKSLVGMPAEERVKSLPACLRSDRKDLFVDKKVPFFSFHEHV